MTEAGRRSAPSDDDEQPEFSARLGWDDGDVNTRLAPGLVWPVRAQDLRSALGAFADQVEVSWLFWVKQATTTPITASWAPMSNAMPQYPEPHHGVKVRVYPVDKQDHQAVRSTVESDLLPDLVRWCGAALAAPEGWKLMRHERRWSLNGDTVSAAEREGVAALHW